MLTSRGYGWKEGPIWCPVPIWCPTFHDSSKYSRSGGRKPFWKLFIVSLIDSSSKFRITSEKELANENYRALVSTKT